METIKFEKDSPVEVALAYAKGREVQSDYPPFKQVMYTFLGDKRAYLPVETAHVIEQDLAIDRHVPFSITKRERGFGKNKTITFDIARLDSMPTDARPIPATVPQSATNTPRNGHAVIPKKEDGVSTTHHQLNQTAAQPAPAVRAYSERAKRLMGCFADAIDALNEGQRYAERRSVQLEVRMENVCSAAITLYINEVKEAR